jgi:hypothetical protein
VLFDQAHQVALAGHDDVVEQFAAWSLHRALGVTLLPRRPRSDPNLLDAEVIGADIERAAADPVAVADQTSDRSVESDRLRDPALPSEGWSTGLLLSCSSAGKSTSKSIPESTASVT